MAAVPSFWSNLVKALCGLMQRLPAALQPSLLPYMQLYTSSSSGGGGSVLHRTAAAAAARRGEKEVAAVAAAVGLQLVQCPLLNVSVCNVSVAATTTAAAAQATAAAAAVSGEQAAQHGHKSDRTERSEETDKSEARLQRSLRGLQMRSETSSIHSGSSSSSTGPGLHIGVSGRSAAAAAAAADGAGDVLLLVVYNPLGWSRQETVRVPVGHTAQGGTYTVQGKEGGLMIIFWGLIIMILRLDCYIRIIFMGFCGGFYLLLSLS